MVDPLVQQLQEQADWLDARPELNLLNAVDLLYHAADRIERDAEKSPTFIPMLAGRQKLVIMIGKLPAAINGKVWAAKTPPLYTPPI